MGIFAFVHWTCVCVCVCVSSVFFQSTYPSEPRSILAPRLATSPVDRFSSAGAVCAAASADGAAPDAASDVALGSLCTPVSLDDTVLRQVDGTPVDK
jgi:hypothetical protein